MARMTGLLLAVLALALLLAGCVSRYERDMALAAERTAQEGYLAQQAQFQALAQQADAQARERIATVEAQERTERATAWYGVLPWTLLIVVAGAAGVGSWWLFLRARVQVEEVRVKALLAAPPVMVLPPERRIPASVQRRADQAGARPVQSGGCWLLVDAGGEVVEVMEPRK